MSSAFDLALRQGIAAQSRRVFERQAAKVLTMRLELAKEVKKMELLDQQMKEADEALKNTRDSLVTYYDKSGNLTYQEQ